MVDVLGWRDLIARSDANESLLAPIERAMRTIYEGGRVGTAAGLGSERYGGRYAVDVQFSQFSDLFVLSTPVKSGSEVYMTHLLADVCAELLEHGHCSRGAIVRGKVVHQGAILYGPAVAEAYDLERTEAKYPRVLVTEPAVFSLHMEPYLRTDEDGRRYLDIFAPDVLNGRAERLARMCETVERMSAESVHDPKLAEKHAWLLVRVRDAVDRTR